jgi:hypothetical protein
MMPLNVRVRIRIQSSNASLINEFESVEGKIEAATDQVSDNGTDVVASTRALLALIKVGRGSRMYIRRAVPKE